MSIAQGVSPGHNGSIGILALEGGRKAIENGNAEHRISVAPMGLGCSFCSEPRADALGYKHVAPMELPNTDASRQNMLGHQYQPLLRGATALK